jgi:hypothetical protein
MRETPEEIRLLIIDDSDAPYMWANINKDNGNVSFKYLGMYREFPEPVFESTLNVKSQLDSYKELDLNTLQTNKIEKDRYFRLMTDLQVNLKPYRILPMYDEDPDLGSFRSTSAVQNPKVGDYLIINADGTIDFNSATYDFSEVDFERLPNIHDLLDKGILKETSNEFMNNDLSLQEKLYELGNEEIEAEQHIDLIHESNDFTEEDLAEESDKLQEIQKQQKIMEEKYEALKASLENPAHDGSEEKKSSALSRLFDSCRIRFYQVNGEVSSDGTALRFAELENMNALNDVGMYAVNQVDKEKIESLYRPDLSLVLEFNPQHRIEAQQRLRADHGFKEKLSDYATDQLKNEMNASEEQHESI